MILLKTKLNVPPLRQKTVYCDRLLDILDIGARGKLTLISAPAGFGKTTLISQWIDRNQFSVGWYSLDKSDNEPAIFYRYLLAAIQSRNEALKRAFDPLLQGQKLPDGREILTHVINQSEANDESTFLVLDDYHMIHSKTIHDDLSFLVQNAPPQLHLFILTRHDPPFPLARLRTKGELVDLRAKDLKFSESETSLFFSQTMDLEISNQDVLELHSKTEGWITGLQIIGLSIQQDEDLERFARSPSTQNRYLLDYLFEEVLDNQSPEIQSFLLKTSILPQLQADLCEEITGVDNSFDLLDQLERTNLFLLPMDDKREWFRYHSLFAEMLQLRLKQLDPRKISDLHKKASLWYIRNDYLEEAFQHALKSTDSEFIANLLEDNLILYLINYEWATARRWLEKLPKELVDDRFLLKLFNALFVFLQEELDNMDVLLGDLEFKLESETRQYPLKKKTYARELFLALKVNYLFYKDSQQVISRGTEALRSISHDNIIANWLIQAVLISAYIQQGDIESAADLVQSALDKFKHSDPHDSGYLKSLLLNKQAELEFHFGRLKNSERLINEALDQPEKNEINLRPSQATYNIFLTQIYYSQNQLDRAMYHAGKCIEYTKPVSDIGFLLLGLKFKAFIHQIRGEKNLAIETMEEAMSIARHTQSAIRISFARLASVQLALARSDFATVQAWVDERQLDESEPFNANFEEESILLAGFYLRTGNNEWAKGILEKLRPRSLKRSRFYSLMKIDIILASSLYAKGESEKATEILERCIKFAGTQGYARSFIDYSAYIKDILFSLRKNPDGPVRLYAQKILKLCDITQLTRQKSNHDIDSDNENLTEREVEILKLISIGLTNKEIASQSFISLNTVKTHVRNIYGKLEVKDREQAILKAKHLDIT